MTDREFIDTIRATLALAARRSRTMDDEPKECPFCHYHNITDDFVYTCPTCGREMCPDCAGRCGCPQDDEDE